MSEDTSKKSSISRQRGGFLVVFSGFAYALSGVLVKFVSDDISVTQLVFIRKSLEMMFSFTQMKMEGMSFVISDKRPWVHLVPLVIPSGVFLGWFAFEYGNVGNCLAILSMNPIIAAPLGWYFLEEKIHWTYPLALIVTFTGVIFIIQPAFFFKNEVNTHDDILGYILIVALVLTMGLWFPFQKLSQLHAYHLVFYGAIWSVFPTLIGMLFFPDVMKWKNLSPKEWSYALAITGCAYSGLVSRTFGTNIIPANISSVLFSSETLFAYLFQYILLDQGVNTLSYFGAILIIMAVIYLSCMKEGDSVEFEKLEENEEEGDLELDVSENVERIELAETK